jgi:hypothetical protein
MVSDSTSSDVDDYIGRTLIELSVGGVVEVIGYGQDADIEEALRCCVSRRRWIAVARLLRGMS